MDPSSLPAGAEHELETARRQLREGRRKEAEQSFMRLLLVQPENAEALTFLGVLAHARRDDANAVNLLSRAAKANPADFDILVQLGAVYRTVEQFDAARYVFERAVRLAAGRSAYVRLVLANLLELDRRPDLALLHYFRALHEAQKLRRWGSDDRNTTGLGGLVEHARQYVARGRRAFFEQALNPVRLNAAEQRWDRIDQALAMYLEGRPPVLADPRQRPSFMYVPGIKTASFLDPARFDWLDRGAALIAACLGEIDACVAASAASNPPAAGESRRVSVLHAGVLQYEARQCAPQLQRVLAGLPLAQVPHQAPDVEIIALGGSGLAPHHSRGNSRCSVVFNPAGSAAFEVIVGGEKRLLSAGCALVLDGSFGVQYANPDGRVRAVSVEAWHPDLSLPEQAALSALLAAAVDFDSRLQDLD